MSDTDDASGLVRAHEAAETHRQRAEIERRLRMVMRVQSKEVPVLLSNCTAYEVEARSAILSAGSDLAWRILDEDRVSLRTVLLMVRRAKSAADSSGRGLDAELADEYGAIKSGTSPIRGRNGRTVLRRPMRARTADEWKRIRTITESIVSREMSELDEVEREAIIFDLRVDIDVLVRQYKSRIKTRVKNGLRGDWNDRTERRKMIAALRALGMDPPSPGGVPDMDLVRRTFRRVAADSHPDRHQGNEHVASVFRSVNQAYQTIVEYVNFVKERK